MGVFKRPRKPKKGQKQYWYLRFWKDGKEIVESTHHTTREITKNEAIALFQARLSEIESNGYEPPSDVRKHRTSTLSSFTREYIEHKKDVEGISDWRRYLSSLKNAFDYFGDIPLVEITPKRIDDFKKARRRMVTAETVNHDLRCLRNFLDLAIRWGYVKKSNPVTVAGLLSSSPKERRQIEPEEEAQLLAAAPQYFADIIICGIDTGMRVSEIVEARKSHIDTTAWSITIPGSKSEKLRKKIYEKKARTIPLTDRMVHIVKRRLKSEDGSPYLFPNSRGEKWYSYKTLSARFRKLTRRVGIKGLTFHNTRHTFATRLLDGGALLTDVQTLLGHKDPKTTAIYNHPGKNLTQTISILNKAL